MKTKTLIHVALAIMPFLVVACSTDDTFEEEQQKDTQATAIGFGSYIGRSAQTRGTAIQEPAGIALNGGIGIYAMYTNGGKYDPESTDETARKEYDANFMYNTPLRSTYSNSDISDGKATALADHWTYGPLRYWPQTSSEYVSFMAYAPYNYEPDNTVYELYDPNDKGDEFTQAFLTNFIEPLYNNGFESSGDRTYKMHWMSKDPRNHVDLLYSNGTNITNMQYYKKDDGTMEQEGDFLTPTDEWRGTTPMVKLNFKHATSRIGFAITSSGLTSVTYNGKVGQAGEPGDAFWFEVFANVEADMYIVVNKVMFLGDNKSAETDNPKGAFYPYGLLNLANTSTSKPLWVPNTSADKIAFTYDNTDTVRTMFGDYYTDGEKADLLYGDGQTGAYKWVPFDMYEYIETGSWNRKRFYPDWNDTFSFWEDQGYSEATINKSIKPEWEYIYKQGNEIHSYYSSEGNGTVTKESGEIGEYIGSRSNDYMFIIPQDFTEGNTEGNELYAYIDYTVKYSNVTGEAANAGFNYKVYQKVNANFEAGKAYLLVFDINPAYKKSDLNTINFTVTSTAWDDETGTSSDLSSE